MSGFEVAIPADVRDGTHVKMRLVGYADPRMIEDRVQFHLYHGPFGVDNINDGSGTSPMTSLYESPLLDDGQSFGGPGQPPGPAFPGVHDPERPNPPYGLVGGVKQPTTYDIEQGVKPFPDSTEEGVQWVFDWTTLELAIDTVPAGYSLYIENSSSGGGIGSNAVLRGLWWIYEGSAPSPLSNIVVGARGARAHFAG